MKINIKKLTTTAKIPTRGSEYAAGYDLYADITKELVIEPHETAKIGTGLSIEIPDGYFGAVFARSGLAAKQALRPANCVGVCDGITNWVPTMIAETYGVSASFSVFLTVILPVLNAFGAYVVVPLYKKLGENEMKTAGVTGLFALVPMVLLLFIGKLPIYIIIILLAVTTSAMYANLPNRSRYKTFPCCAFFISSS